MFFLFVVGIAFLNDGESLKDEKFRRDILNRADFISFNNRISPARVSMVNFIVADCGIVS